jgi:hypothetical protein
VSVHLSVCYPVRATKSLHRLSLNWVHTFCTQSYRARVTFVKSGSVTMILIGIINEPLLLHLFGCLYYSKPVELSQYLTNILPIRETPTDYPIAQSSLPVTGTPKILHTNHLQLTYQRKYRTWINTIQHNEALHRQDLELQIFIWQNFHIVLSHRRVIVRTQKEVAWTDQFHISLRSPLPRTSLYYPSV